MNARNLLIPLLCVAAVAFACGPRSHSEASLVSTSIAREAPRAPHVPRKAARSTEPHISAVLAVHVQPGSLGFAFDVTNDGKKNVELDFPNGQTYELAVQDANGREVYRWGKDRMFTQSVQNRTLDGGETMHIAERASPSLAAGSYVAVATLRSSNFPVTERVAFELR